MILSLIDLGPLGLYEDIDDARPRARDSCTSYATENTDYLTASTPPFGESSKILNSVRASNLA